MSEFAEKINDLLSNPEALSKIMQIAQNLGASGGNTTENNTVKQASQEENEPSVEVVAQAEPSEDVEVSTDKNSDSASAFSSLLSSGSALAPLLSSLVSSSKDNPSTQDKRIELLKALKPFMTETKQKRVDSVISAIGISTALGKVNLI